jgi:prevent-host-death family protein
MQVNVHEAKTNLSRLLERVEAGEEVTIARDGVPVAQLVAASRSGAFPFDSERGRVWMADDFDTLPPGIEAMFYGKSPRKARR